MKKSNVIKFKELSAMVDTHTWRQIAHHFGVSTSTAERAYKSGKDYPIRNRKDRVNLKTVNDALSKADKFDVVLDPALILQKKLASLVVTMRKRNVSRLVIDAESGEASLTCATTHTVKVGQ